MVVAETKIKDVSQTQAVRVQTVFALIQIAHSHIVRFMFGKTRFQDLEAVFNFVG